MRRLLLFLLCFLIATNAHAGAYSVTRTCTETANYTNTLTPWNKPANGAVEDGVFTDQNPLPAFTQSDWLNSTLYSGFGIPQYAIITGVLAELLIQCDLSDDAYINGAYLTSPRNTPVSSLNSSAKPINTSMGWGDKGSTIGGDGDTWGMTSAQLQSWLAGKFMGFEFYIEEMNGNTPVCEVDAVRLTVYYDLPKRLPLLGAGL